MIAKFCFWWLWRLEVNPILTKDFNHWYQFSSKKLGPLIMCVWEQDWVKLIPGRSQTLNRCQSETWIGSWVFVQIFALIFSSFVSLAAYSLQLGRRLQLTVSGPDQRRGGRHPGESAVSNCFSLKRRERFLLPEMRMEAGLRYEGVSVLVQVLTWGTDGTNHGTSTQ